MEVEIKENLENNTITLEFLPFDFLLLDKLLEDFSRIKINRIHAVIFTDGNGHNHTYIKEDNFRHIMGKIENVNALTDFFRQQKNEYTINKLDMDCGDLNVFFDDDAMLILSFPKDRVVMDFAFAKKIFQTFFPLKSP
jgi:hypothetical protein